jgi:hypothetical protein
MPNYKLKVLATALLSLTLFNGCSTARLPATVLAPLPYSAALATAEAKVPTLADIFTLSVEQQAEFLAYFTAPERQTIAAHERLYQFLERKISGFDYQGKNHTAAQAYALNSGNCMSFAVLTKALADIAGIDVKFQSIVSAPVYSIENDLMLSSDHVRTFLYDPAALSSEGKHYQARSVIIVDYMPTSGYRMTGPRISNETFMAMFYRNLAADALTYFKKASRQAPYIHQLQLELALAYFQNNQLKLAYQTMFKAKELAAGNVMQQRYYAKLEAIKLQQ